MAIRRARRPNASLDMTPMIDCVFQLLIFFMLSSSMMTPLIRITLPQAVTKDAADNPQIVISADADGKFYVNQDPVPESELKDRLRPLLAKAKEKVVTFNGDEKLDYKYFVLALDAARECGAVNVNISRAERR